MTRDKHELEAERLDKLIQTASAPAVEAVAEMAKHPMTFDQMRAQVIRHQMEADRTWHRPRGSKIPAEVEAKIQAQIKSEGLDPDRPYDEVRDGGLKIPDTTR